MSWTKVFVAINLVCIVSLVLLIGVFSYVPPPPPVASLALKTTQAAEVTPPQPIAEVTPQPTPDTRCIIQIDGSQFDVTEFRSIHGGGDIFVCGADMSSLFHNQHPSGYLDLMNQYRMAQL